jgi:hypothetical protein
VGVGVGGWAWEVGGRQVGKAHLDVAAASVEVQMQVLDLAKVGKLVVQGLLVGLLMHVRHHDDPALDGAHRRRAAMRLHVADVGLGRRIAGLGARDVNVHLHVGHCRGM